MNMCIAQDGLRLVAISCESTGGNKVQINKHALKEIKKDELTTTDIWNILKSPDSKILNDGELERGSYRYRLETKYIVVIIAFGEKGDSLCNYNIVG